MALDEKKVSPSVPEETKDPIRETYLKHQTRQINIGTKLSLPIHRRRVPSLEPSPPDPEASTAAEAAWLARHGGTPSKASEFQQLIN